MDVTRRPSDTWIVDFSEGTVEADAALYEAPFIHVQDVVKPMKSKVRNRRERENWWIHARTAPDLRKATTNLSRFIATPRVAKHRLFVWITGSVVIDGQLVVIARDDDTTFGVLHSRAHELWALRMGTSLEDRPRYTPTTTFETFPFPDGLTPDSVPAEFANGHADSIAEASKKLVQLRDTWLNPSEWTDRISEVVPGYPDRVVPKKGHEDDLKKRTLTNLYNQRPPWLDNAHHELDEVVAAAYGWPAGLSDDQILANLLELNLGRATAE
ncbi:MAG: type IIL restriction-modification enzyme MmeI [Pseudomonadota bacterium]